MPDAYKDMIVKRLWKQHAEWESSLQEAEECKSGLIELQNSDDLQQEVIELSRNADELEDKISSMVHLLNHICLQYTKLGTLMKRKKGCIYCQSIKRKE